MLLSLSSMLLVVSLVTRFPILYNSSLKTFKICRCWPEIGLSNVFLQVELNWNKQTQEALADRRSWSKGSFWNWKSRYKLEPTTISNEFNNNSLMTSETARNWLIRELLSQPSTGIRSEFNGAWCIASTKGKSDWSRLSGSDRTRAGWNSFVCHSRTCRNDREPIIRSRQFRSQINAAIK